jgi:hypothetical protein
MKLHLLLYNVWELNLGKKINKLKPYIHKLTLHVDIILLQHKFEGGNLSKRLWKRQLASSQRFLVGTRTTIMIKGLVNEGPTSSWIINKPT